MAAQTIFVGSHFAIEVHKLVPRGKGEKKLVNLRDQRCGEQESLEGFLPVANHLLRLGEKGADGQHYTYK